MQYRECKGVTVPIINNNIYNMNVKVVYNEGKGFTERAVKYDDLVTALSKEKDRVLRNNTHIYKNGELVYSNLTK